MVEEKVNEILIVNELPTTQYRVHETEEKTYDLITLNEAIKEILESVRVLRKNIG
jgi:hypothetical protein